MLIGLCVAQGVVGVAWTAERVTSSDRSYTQLVLKLGRDEIVPVSARWEDDPPAVLVEFPAGRVTGSLPSHARVQRGVIQAIRALYATQETSTTEPPWIQAVRIELRDRYHYTVRAEPGQIVVEIEHPATLTKESFEVGLANRLIVGGEPSQPFHERFRAMQEALVRAHAASRTLPESLPASRQTTLVEFLMPLGASPLIDSPPMEPPRSELVRPRPTSPSAAQPVPGARPDLGWFWVILGVGIAAEALGIWGWVRRRQAAARHERRSLGASSMRVIDQLVWRAVERQGYQALQILEDGTGSLGPLRLVVKEGRKSIWRCVADGAFFEKTTVWQFVQTMRNAAVDQGYLLAPGSFTVPAQRYAQEHGVTLIERDQLMELLSAGAMHEHYTAQVQHVQAKLEDLQAKLGESARQLEEFRRQRNETSWRLGEERAKSATLDQQLAELNAQLQQWQAKAEEWQQEAASRRRQWEESQWYLEEARASAQSLQEQLQAARDGAAQLEERDQALAVTLKDTEQQRDEANWYLGESRASQETLRQQIHQVEARFVQAQEALEAMRTTWEASQRQRDVLEQELAALRAFGERRKAARVQRSDVLVDLRGGDGGVLFHGVPRNINRSGVGIACPQRAEWPTSVSVCLSLPGGEQSIESGGRVVWQRGSTTGEWRSGVELIDLPPQTSDALERFLAHP